jgi:hypothetical protein
MIQAIADVEREIMKALEKQYMDTLMPLRDGIPKILEKQVQRLTRRQSIAPYVVPNQVYIYIYTHTHTRFFTYYESCSNWGVH